MSLFALRHILEHIRDKHYDEIDYIIMTGNLLANFFGIRGNISRDGILGRQVNKRLETFASCYSQSLLLYWRILKKTVLLSGFKNPYKTIRETRKLKSIHE
jgi:hypothetical protein